MSEADKMFKELGYEKTKHYYHSGEVIEYENEERSPIDFMIEQKEIKIWSITIEMPEIQAIQKSNRIGVVR